MRTRALPIVALLVLLLPAAVAGPPPSQNWPSFRGPAGDGHATSTGLPLMWSETQNVKWSTAIHGRAWSSPVVWDNQIWMTTATEDGTEMFAVCVDRRTGRILLDKKLFHNDQCDPIADINSYGSPTPAIEAGRVYVHFGTYGTACLDTKSFEVLWTRRNLNCRHSVGPGSSPILAGGLLILTLDGTDVQFSVGLDKKTGATVWKTDRATQWSGPNGSVPPEMHKSFCTPIPVTIGGKSLVLSPGALAAYAYDPATGKDVWSVRYANGYSLSARPVIGDGVAYICTGYDKANMIAVRLDGAGDVTASNVLWTCTRNVPFKPSPILIDDLIYFVDDAGVMSCLDARTGAEVWKERIGGHYSASPIYADGKIYCFSEEGRTLVFRRGRKLDKLAENELSGGFMASPAISGQALYLRTKTRLYCIQE